MSTAHIQYRAGYKYQLAAEYRHTTMIYPPLYMDTAPIADVIAEFMTLDTDSNLTVKRGYAFDGPSGGVRDTHRNLRASLVHDAFYQLMRLGLLKRVPYKDLADKLFQSMCKADGVWAWKARLYYQGLKWFGNPAADPANAKKVRFAPEGG